MPSLGNDAVAAESTQQSLAPHPKRADTHRRRRAQSLAPRGPVV